LIEDKETTGKPTSHYRQGTCMVMNGEVLTVMPKLTERKYLQRKENSYLILFSAPNQKKYPAQDLGH